MSVKQNSVPEWNSFWTEDITENDICRHFMFLGETGSGKTVSGIKPLCRLAFSKDSAIASGVVVDPKNELGDYISELTDPLRLIRISSEKPSKVLWQFENRPIEGKDGMSVMENILTFADSYHAQKEDVHNRFWVDGASHLLAALVEVDLALYRNHNGAGVKNIFDFWSNLYGLFEAFKPSKVENADRLQEFILWIRKEKSIESDALQQLITSCNIPNDHTYGYRADNYLFHLFHFVSCSTFIGDCFFKKSSLAIMGIQAGEQLFNGFWAFFIVFLESYRINGKKVFENHGAYFQQYVYMSDATYSSFQSVFNSLLYEFVDQEFTSLISVNPFEAPENRLDIDAVIKQGKIVIYEPGSVSKVSTSIGKVLKAGFFRALLCRERLNNRSALPFYYVCDEFQRFITHDAESGEQSFLDRCRAYKVSCALATQSLSSLRYAFPNEKGSHSINIIINNTGTKMFFRTTDSGTSAALKGLIPEPIRNERPHVVSVRPPSTLQPGECYYVLVNGRSGRGQVKVCSE